MITLKIYHISIKSIILREMVEKFISFICLCVLVFYVFTVTIEIERLEKNP